MICLFYFICLYFSLLFYQDDVTGTTWEELCWMSDDCFNRYNVTCTYCVLASKYLKLPFTSKLILQTYYDFLSSSNSDHSLDQFLIILKICSRVYSTTTTSSTQTSPPQAKQSAPPYPSYPSYHLQPSSGAFRNLRSLCFGKLARRCRLPRRRSRRRGRIIVILSRSGLGRTCARGRWRPR